MAQSSLSILKWEPDEPTDGGLSVIGWEPDALPTPRVVSPRQAEERRPPPIPARGFTQPESVRVTEPPPEPRTVLGTAKDIGITAVKAAIGLPESAVGVADIATAVSPTRRVKQALGLPVTPLPGEALEAVGFQPKRAKDILSTFYSTAQQRGFRSVEDADSVIATAVAALKNPSVIGHNVLESLPSMGLSGAVGRTLVGAGVKAVTAGAVGEGMVSAGQGAEQVRQDTGTLTPAQAGISAVSGAITGALGLLGGKIAQRLGIADVDTMLAAAASNRTAGRNLVRQVLEGAVQEGLLEEFPQSIQEQVAQNLAEDKPAWKDVDNAGVMGFFAGAVMGGGANVLPSRQPPRTPPPAAPSQPPSGPSVPPPPAVVARLTDAAPTPEPPAEAPAVPVAFVPDVTGPTAPITDRNAQARAEAAQQPPAWKERITPGVSPTGVERRAEPPVAVASFEPAELEQPTELRSVTHTSAGGEETISRADNLRSPIDDMESRVSAGGFNREIVLPIVRAIPVAVVDEFGGEKRATDLLLHDQPVPTDRLPAPTIVNVTRLIAAARDVVAMKRAELGSASPGTPEAEHLATLDALDSHLRERASLGAAGENLPVVGDNLGLSGTSLRAETSTPASDMGGREVSTKGSVTPAASERLSQGPILPEAITEIPTSGKPAKRGLGLKAQTEPTPPGGAVTSTPPALSGPAATAPRRGRRLLTAQAISDFRVGIDRVERRGNRTFVIDTSGERAPLEVAHDAVTPEVEANLAKLSETNRTKMVAAIQTTPYLSAEGKTERLRLLIAAGVSSEGVPNVETAPAAPRSLPPGGSRERVAPAGRGAVPAGRHQPSTPRSRTQEAAARDADVLDTLIAQAKTGGFTGDEALLRAELSDRLSLVKDLDTEYNESGHNPLTLLKEIAKLGGLSVKAETGLKGELRWLKEFQDNVGTTLHPRAAFGRVSGVQGVFHERGLSVDDMLTSLRQDQRFHYLVTLSDLLEEIQAAAMAQDNTVAIERLQRGLGERWWETIGHAPDVEPLSDAVEPDEGDVSFDPTVLEAPTVDVLDTGEVQPRLLEAGAVRETEQETPPVAEAPFALLPQAEQQTVVQPLLTETTAPQTQAEKALETLNRLETAARERLQQRGTFSGKRLTAGLPIDDLADLVVIGAVKIAKGTVKFSRWSAEMVADHGEAIRPHLQTLYGKAKAKAKDLRPRYVPSGRDVPAEEPIPEAKRLEFPSLQKMPEPIREDLSALLNQYNGFQGQRRNVQPIERTQALAKDVWLPLESLKPGTALNAEELEAYKTALATALTERQTVLDRIKAGDATDWEKLRFSYLTDVATTLTMSYRGAKAEAGRALRILRVKARVLDLQESAFLEAALGAPGFQRDLKAVSDASIAAQGDPLKQLQFLRARSQGTWFDYLQAFYYTNLLSGLKTHLRNTIGNTVNALANVLTPIGAVPADLLRSTTRGRPRTVFLGEIPVGIAGGLVGMHRGMLNAAFTFRYGFRPSTVEAAEAGRFDTPRFELPGGAWTNWPGRSLEAADEFFRAIARTQETYAATYAQTQREKAPMARVAARMADILSAVNPTTPDGKLFADIQGRADTFAARAVFQEQPGSIVQWLLKAKAPTSSALLRAAALFIAPFIRTPGAILRQGFEFSPAGFAMSAARQGGRAGAQAQGRAVLGTAFVLGPVAWLASMGMLTGAPPDDEGEREEFYAQGKLTNAVRIGDYWVRYVLFQPFSVTMAAVANAWTAFQHSDQDDAAAQDAFAAGIAGAGASLLDQSFLSGLATFLNAVNDPTRSAGRWLALFAQGFVPFSGMARNVTQAVDPTYRRPQGVIESVQAIVPGQSERLLPRRGRFGEAAQRTGSLVQRGFVVPEVSKAVSDDVTATLARLGVRPQAPRPQLTARGERLTLTREQEDIISHAIGRERKAAVDRVLASPAFSRRDEEGQRKALEDALTEAGRLVRARAVRAVQRKDQLTFERLVSPRVQQQLTNERAAFQQLVAPAPQRATGTDNAPR